MSPDPSQPTTASLRSQSTTHRNASRPQQHPAARDVFCSTLPLSVRSTHSVPWQWLFDPRIVTVIPHLKLGVADILRPPRFTGMFELELSPSKSAQDIWQNRSIDNGQMPVPGNAR
eukprot:2169778-Rhodomonas_salina.2